VEEARRVALAVLEATGTTVNDLWVSFWSMGGSADALELDAYVHGVACLNYPLLECVMWKLRSSMRTSSDCTS
jgi:hypothetical protein